jgi:uncharacterized protein (DUF1684 family)
MEINNRRNSTFIIAGVGALFAIILLFQWVLNDDAYLIGEESFRKGRDEFFRSEIDSPLPDSLRPKFKGLDWFPVTYNFKIVADFEKNPKFEQVEMPRSAAGPEKYIRAGWLHFKIKGQDCVLTAFNPNPKDNKTLFVPFRDATTGQTTYGGGRYIDTRLADNKVILDFNRAYNPYCVYNYTFACPIPPQENTLKVAIEAGEKDWKGI